MEGTTLPEAPPKRRRRMLFALGIGAALIVAGFGVWWAFIRPRTIAEVLAFDHFQPGTQALVAGSITSITWDNRSQGPRVLLGLDNEPTCQGRNVVGDPNATYRLGQSFQTTLHFERYSLNGDPAVSAPELPCPFPTMFESIGLVADSVSDLDSILLAYNGTDDSGWSHYEIETHNGESYRADILPATLVRFLPLVGYGPRLPAGSVFDSTALWELIGSLYYLMFTGEFRYSVIDRLPSLAATTSANGSMRFVDVDANGMVDDGDRLDIRIAPTPGANAWDFYQLEIGQWGPLAAGHRYVNAVHVFLNGPNGPWDVPIRERTVARLDFGYSESRLRGTITSRLDLVRMRFGKVPTVSRVQFALFSGATSSAGNLSQLPVTLSNGATLSFADTNGNGLLDPGDALTMTNSANRTGWSLSLQTANATIATAGWTVGYGTLPGALPDVSFTISGTNPWQATANISFWSPAVTLNGTARVSLEGYGGPYLLNNITLGNGSVGTFAGGSLSFLDADGDGTLSTGDHFTLQGNPSQRYSLGLSLWAESPRWVTIP